MFIAVQLYSYALLFPTLSLQRLILLPSSDSYDPSKDFTCFDGSRRIPFSYVNDDYCDCNDGSDEPGTSACPEGTFFCENKGHVSRKIPSSRVNDGYCDCCDASDEYLIEKCSDICEELGAKARQFRGKAYQLFTIGYQIRLQLAASGNHIKKEREQTMFELDNKRIKYITFLKEKEYLKNVTETKQLEVLKSVGAIKSLKEQKEQEEMKVANNIFSIVDENHDDILQTKEIQQRPIFDEDKDGIVSNEELEFFFDSNINVSRNMFFEIVWPKVKKLYLLDKLDFISSVSKHSEYDIWEAGDEKVNGKETTDHRNWQNSHYKNQHNENITEIVKRASKARSEYKAAQGASESIEQELASIKEALSTDYGPENEFTLLEGQCFNYSDHSFYYKICPFGKVIQMLRKEGPETILGKWAGWLGKEYKTMFYDRGEFCWKDVQYTAKVDINCGLTNEVIRVVEPTRCEYIFLMKTPAGCKTIDTSYHIHDEL